MDGHRFDRMTRQLGHALSRRRFGAVLAALGLGANLGLTAGTAAKKKKKKKPKPCPNGTIKCGAVCVDLQTDPQHCGSCPHACASNETCRGGQCRPPVIETCLTSDDCRDGAPISDLTCNAQGRCECISASVGHHRCLPDAPSRCGLCCAGGTPLGQECLQFGGGITGDLVCRSETFDGCLCPEHMPESCPSRSGFCSMDTDTDPRRCGPFCEDCTLTDAVCCDGFCRRGCSPSTSGSCMFVPCGGNCEVCPEGQMCCNLGPGTPDRCVPGATFCPLPEP